MRSRTRVRQIIFRNVDCSARIANRAIHFEELVFSHALKGAAKKNSLDTGITSNPLRLIANVENVIYSRIFPRDKCTRKMPRERAA